MGRRGRPGRRGAFIGAARRTRASSPGTRHERGEGYAASVTFADFIGSHVMVRYENLRNMAKRAENGALLEKILKAVTAVGKAPGDSKVGFFDRLKRTP